MCKCTSGIKTPYCGKLNCQPPEGWEEEMKNKVISLEELPRKLFSDIDFKKEYKCEWIGGKNQ